MSLALRESSTSAVQALKELELKDVKSALVVKLYVYKSPDLIESLIVSITGAPPLSWYATGTLTWAESPKLKISIVTVAVSDNSQLETGSVMAVTPRLFATHGYTENTSVDSSSEPQHCKLLGVAPPLLMTTLEVSHRVTA